MDLKAIQRRIEKPTNSRTDVIRLLKSLESLLIGNNCSTKEKFKNIQISDIKELFSSILHNCSLVECPSLVVRVRAAACIAAGFRYFAPKIPLKTTGELAAAFELFSTVFSGNLEGNPESPNIIKILDILYSTDSFVLIADNETVAAEVVESMVCSTNKLVIDFVRDLINSSLSSIFINEISNFFAKNIISNKAIQMIIPQLHISCQSKIVEALQKSLNYEEFIKAFIKVSKILKFSFSFIIQSLHFDLIVEDDVQRTAVYSLISQIIEQIEVTKEDTAEVEFVLSRFVDKVPKIRIMILEIAMRLSKVQLFHEKSLKVLNSLKFDPSEAVRLKSLTEISKYTEIGFDLTYFLNDKSGKVRENAVLIICDKIISKYKKDNEETENINNENNHYFDGLVEFGCNNLSSFELFFAFSILTKKIEFSELYKMADDKKGLATIFNEIVEIKGLVQKYIETGDLNPKLSKLITKEIWGKNVTKTNNLSNCKDIKSFTSDSFEFEFGSLYFDINIDIEKVILENNKSLCKSVAKLKPLEFVPFIPKIIENKNKSIVILPFVAKSIESIKFSVYKELLYCENVDSLIVFAKLFCIHKNKIIPDMNEMIMNLNFENSFSAQINLKEFTIEFVYKFLYFIGIPEIINKKNFFLGFRRKNISNIKNPKVMKWALRLSTIFEEKLMVKTQLKLYIKSHYALQVLDSILKMPKNVLCRFSTKQFRLVSSFLTCKNSVLRKNSLDIVNNALKTPKVPIEFLAIVAFEIGDADKIISQNAKKYLDFHFQLRIKFIGKNKTLLPSQRCEYFIPALFNIFIFFEGNYFMIMKDIIDIIPIKKVFGIVNGIYKNMKLRKDKFGVKISEICENTFFLIGKNHEPENVVIDKNNKFLIWTGNEILQ